MLRAHRITVQGRLDDCSLELEPGKVTAICGPNGAGKSTLLEVLAGLLDLHGGQALLDGADLGSLSPRDRARHVGYLPQDGEIAWNLSVATLVSLGRLPHSAKSAENRRATQRALEAMALTGLADRPVAELSGGERARALLARVLAGEPDWILADEPLASLDLAQQAMLMRYFRALAGQGKAIVLVLHDLAAAFNHADQVMVLKEGKVVAQGAPIQSLAPSVIEAVWGLRVQWLGGPGRWALSIDS